MSQEVIYGRRVKEDLREIDAMMKSVTQSHAANIQSVQSGSLALENAQWIRAIEDQHNTVKTQAKDKLEEMGAGRTSGVGRSKLRVNFKTHPSLAGVEGWATELRPGKKQACFQTEWEERESEERPPKKNRQGESGNGLCHNCSNPGLLSWAYPSLGGGKGSESQGRAAVSNKSANS